MAASVERIGGLRFLAGSTIIAASSFVSVLAGFGINLLVAARYGIGPEVDAFFVANTLPALMLGLSRVSCTSVLVPAFSRCCEVGAPLELRRLLSVWVTAAFVAGSVVAAVGVLASPYLVSMLAPGSSPQVKTLAIELARVLFASVLFAGAVQVLRAFFYSQGLVALPSTVDAIQKLVVIVVFVVVGQRSGIFAVAYGFCLGACAQLAVELGFVARRWGRRYVFLPLDFSLTDLRAARQLSMSLLSSLLGQGAIISDRIVASFLPEGSIAVLGYARTIFEVLVQVVISPAPLALLPSLARSLAHRSKAEVSEILGSLLSFMCLVSVPLGAGLILLAAPAVSIMLHRGSFDQAAVSLTASTLAAYAVSTVIHGYFRAVELYLYADMRASRVAVLFFIFLVGTIGLDVVLVPAVGVRGIALAYAGALFVPLILGILLARQDLTATIVRRWLGLNAKVITASTVAFWGCSALATALSQGSGSASVEQQAVIAGILAAVFVLGVIAIASVLRIEELGGAVAYAARRLAPFVRS